MIVHWVSLGLINVYENLVSSAEKLDKIDAVKMELCGMTMELRVIDVTLKVCNVVQQQWM